MIKLFFLSFLMLISSGLLADIPGNKPRTRTLVHVKGVERLPKGWLLYKESGYESSADVQDNKRPPIRKDTTLIIRGGYGRPDFLRIWAKNSTTGKMTPNLFYRNNDKAHTLTILTIRNDSLILEANESESTRELKKKTKNNNVQKNGLLLLDVPANDEEIAAEEEKEPIGLLIGIALVSIALLGWIYFRKKQAGKKAR